jgi:ferredoxin/flavodoxin---NADP+ reductase
VPRGARLTPGFPRAYGRAVRFVPLDLTPPGSGAPPASHEVVIVGGGPAGLTAGMYCRMRRLSVLIVDAGSVGGQLVSMYADKPVHDWPGYKEVIANDLAGELVTHAKDLEVQIAENEKVVDIRRVGDAFEVVTQAQPSRDERVHPATAVIVAIGAGALEPRKLKLEGEDTLGPRHLTYRMPDPEQAAGRRVVVVGGGDSGLESALAAHRVGAASVTVVHTHSALKAMEVHLEAADQANIPRLLETRTKALEIADGRLCAVIVESKGSPEPRRLECDYLVVNIGAAVNLESVQRWGIEIDAGHIKVDGTMQTSVPGLFACGDIVAYPGKYKLLITASSEGAVAANSAYAYVKKPTRVTMRDLYT